MDYAINGQQLQPDQRSPPQPPRPPANRPAPVPQRQQSTGASNDTQPPPPQRPPVQTGQGPAGAAIDL